MLLPLLPRESGLLWALDFRNECFPLSDSIEITVTLEDFPLEELKDLLAAGETSRIHFEARLFQERRGILSLIGDQMLEAKEKVYSIHYDRLGRYFVLHTPSGDTVFKSFVSLVRPLRSTHFTFNRRESEGHYLETRVTFLPRKLVPPFNLLEIFFLNNKTRLKWKKIPLNYDEGGL